MKERGYICVSIDKETVRLLDVLAKLDYEGNHSMTIRQLIRKDAKERGVEVEDAGVAQQPH